MCRFISSQFFESQIFLEQLIESIIYFLTKSQPQFTWISIDLMSQHNKSFQKSSSQKALSIKSHAEKILLQKSASIDVLSDQQQQDIINDRYQQEILQNKIQQAVLTKSKYNVLKVLYVQLNFKGKSERQKQKRWNNIIKGFIARNLNTQAGQPYDIKHSFFNQKMVSNPNDQYIQNEYILYGCDLLSHKHIQKIFSPFNPTIKWINASHCKLTFMQKNQGWQAVINNCKDVSTFLKEMQQNLKVQTLLTNLHLQSKSQSHPNHQSQQQILTQQKQQQKKLKYRQQFLKFEKLKKKYVLLKKYVQLSPYYELGFKRRLMIRNVTKSEQLMGYNIKVNDKDKKDKQIKPSQSKEQRQKQNHIFTQQAQRKNNPTSTTQRRLSQDKVNLNNKSISKQGTSDYKKFIKIKQDFWKDIQENQLVKPQYQKVLLKQQLQQQIIRLKGKQPSNRGANNNNYSNNKQRSEYGQRQKNQNFRGRGGFYKNFNRNSDRNEIWTGQNHVNSHQYKQNDHRIFERRNEQFPQQQIQRIRSREHYPQQNYQRGRGGYHGRGGYRSPRGNFNTYNDRNGYSNTMNYRDKRFRKWDQAERDFDSYVEQREGLKMIEKPHQNCQLAFVDQKTGIHFYKNPLYDPSTQYNLQQYNTYNQGKDSGYPIQASLPRQNKSISYEYRGNSANLSNFNQQMQYQQGSYQQSHLPQQMNPHYINQNPNYPMSQQNSAYHPQQPQSQYKPKPVVKKSQRSQQQFQKYVANRKQAPQLQDPNCSVINASQTNLHNQINFDNLNNNPSGANENLGNWDKILDNIHSDDQNDYTENQRDVRIIGMGDNGNMQRNNGNNRPQAHQDDDDSSNLDFLLQSQRDKPQQTNIKKQSQLKQQYISRVLDNVVYQQLPIQQLQTWLNSNLDQKSIDQTRELDNFTNGNNILTNSQTMSQNSNKHLRKQKQSISQARTQGPSIKMKKIRDQSEKKRIPKKKKDTTLGLFRKG